MGRDFFSVRAAEALLTVWCRLAQIDSTDPNLNRSAHRGGRYPTSTCDTPAYIFLTLRALALRSSGQPWAGHSCLVIRRAPCPSLPHPPHFSVLYCHNSARTLGFIGFIRCPPSGMILPFLVILSLSLSTVTSAGPTKHGGRRCWNHLTPEEINANEGRFSDALSTLENPTMTAGDFSNHTVSVHFNVISSGTELSQGHIPCVVSPRPCACPSETCPHFLCVLRSRDKQIKDQIDVLNGDYSGTGLQFQLVNVTRVVNANWFKNVGPGTPEQTEMKAALRRGGPDALNIFTVSLNNSAADDIIGYTTFPANYSANPEDDGVVVYFATLPGGTAAPTNLGRTITHETGHWVGLYHTFLHGCDDQGDHVDDTPSEADPAYGCPIGRDTCKAPGLDRKLRFLGSASTGSDSRY